MEKKSVAATILVLFTALTFSVIGICFSVYKYQDTKIEITEVKIVASRISVYSDKNLTKEAKTLKLSDMKLGLKPATGKLDTESEVPSTITNEGTSEGYYASVFVPAGKNYKIFVTDIKIKTNRNQMEANNERKNIFVSIKDIENSTKSLENDRTEIVKFENTTENQELIFLIWLGSLASDELIGAKISFTLSFETI